jgi:hypothetical protein
MEKQLFSPFLGQSANGVLIHHVRLFQILPVSITVLYYGRFTAPPHHNKTKLCWRIMRVYQYVYISIVLPHYGCQATLTLVLTSSYFNFIFCQKIFGISCLLGLTVPQQFIVSSNNSADEKYVHV